MFYCFETGCNKKKFNRCTVTTVLVPNLAGCPLSRLTAPFSSCPMESAVSLVDCVHRGWWLECWCGPASCPAELERGVGCYWGTVTETSVLPYLVGDAQLRVSGNSSCGYIAYVLKTLSPAGAYTLVHLYRLSVSTKSNLSQLKRRRLKSLKRWPQQTRV